jgi:UDP-glucose 4-epimerase
VAKVMVTGGLGVQGSWVVRALLEADHGVIALDIRDDRSLVADVADEFEVVIGDCTDETWMADTLRRHGADIVVHLAAMLASACAADPRRAVAVNVEGTRAVLAAASIAGVRRVVFASSVAVYAGFTGRHGHPRYEPVPESHVRAPLPLTRVYGATKIAGEELGLHYHESHGLEFVGVRFSHIVGPSMDVRHSVRNPPAEIVEAAIAGKPLRVAGGDQRADMLYVKDLARGVVCGATAAGAPSGVYNIGSGRLATLHDVAAVTRELVPDADIAIEPGLDFLGLGPLYPLLDISHAGEHLGYTPRYDVRGLVADYLAVRAQRP